MAPINCVDDAEEEEELLKRAEVTVPEGENVFPVRVSVATRLFAVKSITLEAPEERLTARKVKLDPVSEQNCAVEPEEEPIFVFYRLTQDQHWEIAPSYWLSTKRKVTTLMSV